MAVVDILLENAMTDELDLIFFPMELKRRRSVIRMTQETLALEAHIGLRQLQRMEAGEIAPTGRELERLSTALGCSPSAFYLGDPYVKQVEGLGARMNLYTIVVENPDGTQRPMSILSANSIGHAESEASAESYRQSAPGVDPAILQHQTIKVREPTDREREIWRDKARTAKAEDMREDVGGAYNSYCDGQMFEVLLN